jgi:hypothetical protein
MGTNQQLILNWKVKNVCLIIQTLRHYDLYGRLEIHLQFHIKIDAMKMSRYFQSLFALSSRRCPWLLMY